MDERGRMDRIGFGLPELQGEFPEVWRKLLRVDVSETRRHCHLPKLLLPAVCVRAALPLHWSHRRMPPPEGRVVDVLYQLLFSHWSRYRERQEETMAPSGEALLKARGHCNCVAAAAFWSCWTTLDSGLVRCRHCDVRSGNRPSSSPSS